MEMLKYRADIDGLRAIAVLLVVLFHAKFPIPGGFVGVDVFFVISGFLITSIIDKEIRLGEFSFKSFYARRIKRLVPPFIAMLILVGAYCSYYLMPADLLSFSKSAALSMIGASNFYFYLHTNYFDSAATEPLLHTWSLSVEEQFYIFWPLILIGLYKINRKSVTIVAFFALFACSVMASQYYVTGDKNLAYMMLPFRFFELMAGAILAIRMRTASESMRYNSTIALAGLALVIGSGFILNESSEFPGLLALPVVIGTVMIIASGAKESTLVSRALSLRPVVYVGKISYSLYLWHWPVLILASYRGITLDTYNATILVLVATVLACASYHFVENPTRRAKSNKVIYGTFYALPVVIVLVFMNKMIGTNGMEWRMEGLFSELDDSNTAHVVRAPCMEKMKVGNFEQCWLGVKKKKPDALMIGDSFGNAYTGFVGSLAKDAGLMVHDTMRSSTPSIPGVYASPANVRWGDWTVGQIVKYNNKRTTEALNYKMVIISDFFDQYSPDNKSFRVYDSSRNDVSDSVYERRLLFIRELVNHGVKVVIIARPFNAIGSEGMGRMRAQKIRHANLSGVKFSYGIPKEKREEYRLKKDIPQITVIDPNDVICSNGKCIAGIDGDIIFRSDGSHLNFSSSEKLGELYLKRKGNPLK